MNPGSSFSDRKSGYYEGRGEEVVRAAHLSDTVTVVSFQGDGNCLSFVYDVSQVMVDKGYQGKINDSSIGVIESSAFVPRIIGFDDAMRFAQEKFKSTEGTGADWYERPDVTIDLRALANHPRKESDKLVGIAVLNSEGILP